MMSSSLCRIWTYESKICTGLQSRKLAEAILTFFNDEVSRKCVLQDFVILSFTCHTVDGKNPAPIRVFGVRIENFVFADLSTSTPVQPCHLEETKAAENVPWRRGYYDQPRSWESDGPGPGDVTDITRKFMAQKAREPPVDVAPRRTIEEKMSDKARQLSQHAAKKRRQLQHLKHTEESSSSSTSSSSSDSDDE